MEPEPCEMNSTSAKIEALGTREWRRSIEFDSRVQYLPIPRKQPPVDRHDSPQPYFTSLDAATRAPPAGKHPAEKESPTRSSGLAT